MPGDFLEVYLRADRTNFLVILTLDGDDFPSIAHSRAAHLARSAGTLPRASASDAAGQDPDVFSATPLQITAIAFRPWCQEMFPRRIPVPWV